MAWRVAPEPKGKNPGVLKKAALATGASSAPDQKTDENVGGMIIYVTDGTSKQEVSRVAFIRRPETCRNPTVGYADQLRVEMAKAHETCGVLNATLKEPDEVPA